LVPFKPVEGNNEAVNKFLFSGVIDPVHLKRWITSLVALPIVIALIYQGGVLFLLLIYLACICSLWEYYRIVFNADARLISSSINSWGYVVGLLILGVAYRYDLGGVALIVAFNIVIVGLFSVFVYRKNPQVGDIVQKQIQGIVYIPLLFSFLVLIRREPEGMAWIFLLLAVIFAGDTSAYYVGTYLGRHKLSPAVSPGKTVEGALGGLAGNLLVGSAAFLLFLPTLSWAVGVVFFLSVGIAGQVGDLFESGLKRSSSVKDSSRLLPGHGGFLDRIDALLFASPVAYLFIVYIF
jgi:phosphatidate cytidylyltransferase